MPTPAPSPPPSPARSSPPRSRDTTPGSSSPPTISAVLKWPRASSDSRPSPSLYRQDRPRCSDLLDDADAGLPLIVRDFSYYLADPRFGAPTPRMIRTPTSSIQDVARS